MSTKLKRHQIVLLVVAIVLVAFLAGVVTGALAFLVAPVSGANTKTQSISVHTWRGLGTFSQEEALDAPVYVSGFRDDGQSEKMVAGFRAVRTAFSCTEARTGDVRWWFKSASGEYPKANTVAPADLRDANGNRLGGPGAEWVLLREQSDYIGSGFGCQDNANMPASIASIRGNFIGTVRAEFLVFFQDVLWSGWNLMAVDEASVVPGWGVFSIQNPASLVQVGEDLLLHYDVGAACSVKVDSATREGGCGWILTVRNRDTGAIPQGWDDVRPADFTEKTLRVRVTPSWFTIGAHNEYDVKLFNQLNTQRVEVFVTIDDRNLAPGTPSIAVSPGPPYRQGAEVVLTVTASPNPITIRDIASYHVIVRQGGRVLVDVRSPSGLVTFTIADEQIDVRIEATAFDGERTGGVKRLTLVVLDTDLDNNPPPSNAPEENPGLILLLAGAILVLVGLGIPLPKSLGILSYVTVIVGLAIVAAAFVVGVHLPFLGRVGL